MYVTYLHVTTFFDNGHTKWENMDTISFEGNSPPSSSFETQLIHVLK